MSLEARKQVVPLLFAGLFLLIDRVFKWLAPTSTPLGNQLFGWEYFENPGIAFSIPLPTALIAVVTPIILILLFAYTTKGHARPGVWLGWWLVFFGAVSNLADRLLYGFVIDYLRIYQGVINIADIMILAGMCLIFFSKTDRS